MKFIEDVVSGKLLLGKYARLAVEENMLAKSLTSNHSKSFLLKSFLDGKEKKEVGDFARLTLK